MTGIRGSKKGKMPSKFIGPSTQRMLDAYGYNTIEEISNMELLSQRTTMKSKQTWKPQTRENTDKVIAFHVQVTGSVLGLPNVTTWDEIEKKIG
ncbi:hypothetical protein Tco_1216534 [Tanacetum coccineum]